MITISQDPSAKIAYTGTWARRFPGGTIAESTWEVYRDGVVSTELVVYSDASSGLSVSWRMSGGVVGAVYVVTNHVTLADGQEDDGSIRVVIAES